MIEDVECGTWRELRKLVGIYGVKGVRRIVDNMAEVDGLPGLEDRMRRGRTSVPVNLQRSPGDQRQEVVVSPELGRFLIEMARRKLKT